MKKLPAAGQDLMSVCLMTHIPDNFIIRSTEDIMKGDSKFHNTQTGSKMSGIAGNNVNDKLPQFPA